MIHQSPSPSPTSLHRLNISSDELLYAIAPAYWKQGLITESAKAVLQYGFESLGLERIVPSADVPNVSSIRVMEKIGMRFEKQEQVDELEPVFYSITREGFVSEETP